MPEFNFAQDDDAVKKITKQEEDVLAHIAPPHSLPPSCSPPENAPPPAVFPHEAVARQQQAPTSPGLSPENESTGNEGIPADFSVDAGSKPQTIVPTPPIPVSDLSEISTSDDDESWVDELSAADSTETNAYSKRSSNMPLIGFIVVVVLLLATSFIWYVNPYPPLKNWINGLFTSTTKPHPGNKVGTVAQIDSTKELALAAPASTMADSADRIWNYYLQVASQKQLSIAQHTANAFRKRGLTTVVEGEYIRKKKATFYRVRLGPFESVPEAKRFQDSMQGLVPRDAFIDSVRKEYDSRPQKSSITILQPESRGGLNPPKPSSAISAEPSRGFGVKVSSHRDEAAAKAGVRTLLGKGYPAFMSRSTMPSGTWFRVYVGPFASRKEADRYSQLLREMIGSEVYTIEFARP